MEEIFGDDIAFWAIIDGAAAQGGDVATRQRAIAAQLATLDEPGLVRFEAIAHGWLSALRRHDLWGAAFILLGGCGDDAFDAFRGWLIVQGRAAVDAVLADPDVLAGWQFDEHPWFEGLTGIADELHTERTGQPLPQVLFYVDRDQLPPDRLAERWTEEEAEEAFPRIAADPLWRRRKP